MNYYLMTRPTWQGSFARTVGDSKIQFDLGESVEVTADALSSLLPDVGKALVVAKFDDKGRPKPDWDKTQRLVDGESVDDVFADAPPVVDEGEADEPISLQDSLIPKTYHSALKKNNLHTLQGIALYLESHDDLRGLDGIAETGNKEILEALEAHAEPA